MSIHRVIIALVSVSSIAAVAAACTVQQAGPTGSSGGTPTADGGGVLLADAGGPALNCLQILQCIIACPDSDEACPDACAAKGTPEGQEKINAFASCVETEKCTEATCIQDKCGTLLSACTSSSTPKTNGSPLPSNVPAGSVPADLVGSWAGANFGETERLVFNADGTGYWQSAIATDRTGCFSTSSTTRSGNMVITDTTITVYATSVKTRIQTCSPPAEEGTGDPGTEVIQYTRKDANTLSIIDNTCAKKYAGSDYSIGFYCSSRITRE